MALNKTEKRLEEAVRKNPQCRERKKDSATFLKYREEFNLPPNLTKEQLYQNRNLRFRSHQRKLSEIKQGEYHEIMTKLQGEYAVQGIRWYLGSFPRNPRVSIQIGGMEVQNALKTLKYVLEKQKWEANDMNELKRSLDILVQVQPDEWNKRKKKAELSSNSAKRRRIS